MDQQLYGSYIGSNVIAPEGDSYFDTVENYDNLKDDSTLSFGTQDMHSPYLASRTQYSSNSRERIYPVSQRNSSEISYGQTSSTATTPRSVSFPLHHRSASTRPTPSFSGSRAASAFDSFSPPSHELSSSPSDVTEAAAEIGRRFLLSTCGILFALCFLLPLLFEYIFPLVRSRGSSHQKPEPPNAAEHAIGGGKNTNNEL